MNTPKVSIVLPNYNYARYLDERIQSVLNQTYQDFELIILDDASTDDSLKVIDRYSKHKNVSTHFFQVNSKTTYKRWNDGANMAKGEYLMFAGADDSCDPSLLEKLVGILDSNPTVGLAYSQSWFMDESGTNLFTMKRYTDILDSHRWISSFIDSGESELLYMSIENTIFNASSVLIRRSKFLEHGGFDTKYRLASDWLLWFKILADSDIGFVCEPLNNFRHHNKTVRKVDGKGIKDMQEIFDIVSELIQSPHLNEMVIDRLKDRVARRFIEHLVKRDCLSKDLLGVYKQCCVYDKRFKRRLPTEFLRLGYFFFSVFSMKLKRVLR
jgi:glycosyltransferase involved in cell wall biosynthesis